MKTQKAFLYLVPSNSGHVKTDWPIEIKNGPGLRFLLLSLSSLKQEEVFQLECFLNTVTEDYSQAHTQKKLLISSDVSTH